jgi:preprotein translocase subunit SecA
MRELERRVLLSVMDRKWREHLYEMDYLQEGIGLRAMGQRDPLVEYQREGFDLFNGMMEAIKEESVGFLFNVEVKVEGADQAAEAAQAVPPRSRRPTWWRPVPVRRPARWSASTCWPTTDGPRRSSLRRPRAAGRLRPSGPAAADGVHRAGLRLGARLDQRGAHQWCGCRSRRPGGRGAAEPQRPLLLRIGAQVQALPRRFRE